MAKITGMSGMVRGKSGPNVYRVTRGVQVMQQYNPNPNNPRSPKQTDRRLIFADAVRMAKAFYDNPVTGDIWKKTQYKPRNLAVSEALREPNLSTIEGTELTRLAAANINQNWTSGFDMFGNITGTNSEGDWKFNCLLETQETNQPIIGIMVILYARPGYNYSEDDNMVYDLPAKPLVQAIAMWKEDPIVPGGSYIFQLRSDDFKFGYDSSNLSTPTLGMPPVGEADKLGKIAINRAWFAIPLTLENTGKGLRMEINNRMVTLGPMQYIWEAE